LRTRYTLFALLVVGLVWVVSAFSCLGQRHTQGLAVQNLEARGTLETRDLVESFGEMHHQVNLRLAELDHRARHSTGTPTRRTALPADDRHGSLQGGQ